MQNDNLKTKNYYAPTSTFLVFLFYVILATFVLPTLFWENFTIIIFFIALIVLLLIERIIRLSYYIKFYDGKLYECGLLTLKRVIPVSEIKKIRWQKENFWTGGTNIATMGNSNWLRQFYIESDKNILPKYPVSADLIKDLLKIRPDLQVNKERLTFDLPIKKL